MGIYDISKVARNEFICDVVESIEKEIRSTNVDVKNIQSNLMILADEKACAEWEKWFDLSYEPSWTLEDRRNRLIYTFNSKGFFTKSFLVNQANIFTNGEIEVIEEFENWHFIVKFTSVIGIPPNLSNFRNMVEVNKPAHLTWELQFRYRTWRELEPFKWSELEHFTWEQLFSDNTILGGASFNAE